MKFIGLIAVLCVQCRAFSSFQLLTDLRQDRIGKRYAKQAVPVETADISGMRNEAARMRQEAELLERDLWQQKIETIETKLSNKSWSENNAERKDLLENELAALQQKLSGTDEGVAAKKRTQFVKAQVVEEVETERRSPGQSSVETPQTHPDLPKRGYDEEDLAVYIPVATKIEATMPNSTAEEKLAAFRESPELQSYFEEKVKKMLVQPIQDMQRLENLRNDYLQSTSKVEKMNIKREMESIEKSIEADGPFVYSDSIFLNIAPIPADCLAERVEAIGALPKILQSLYLKRLNLGEDGDISLGVQLDHFEQQIQLLEQISAEGTINEINRQEPMLALQSLPVPVRDHFARKYGLDDATDLDAFVKKLSTTDKDVEWSSIQKLVISSRSEEYEDLDYLDRSRYVEELFPALARMEQVHPPSEDVEQFLRQVLDNNYFMVRSKPERVVGGYFVRGYNKVSNDNEGSILVEILSQKLEESDLRDQVEFFFMNDPQPLSDEDFEMDNDVEQVIFLCGKDRSLLTANAGPLTKAGVNLLGVLSMLLFAFLTVELRPNPDVFQGKNLFDLIRLAVPVFGSLVAVQLCHEAGHQVAAMQSNMTIGVPSILPSVATGVGGSITPLASPPRNVKNLFDFAISGPLVGYAASLALLVYGLMETSMMDLPTTQKLPSLPLSLLRSSALGGGLVESFLGVGTLMQGATLPPDAMISLHPACIGGFVGVISSALALLPIGNTDGGRIALAMFGRRGTYVVSIFTTAMLCGAGIFGLDSVNILLTYTLCALLWQRELEIPARNEVEQLDYGRGFIAIGAAFLVFLTLLPMR